MTDSLLSTELPAPGSLRELLDGAEYDTPSTATKSPLVPHGMRWRPPPVERRRIRARAKRAGIDVKAGLISFPVQSTGSRQEATSALAADA
jgi:hypothetical protein